MLDIIWNAVEDEYLTVIMYLLRSIPMRFSGKTSQMIHNVEVEPLEAMLDSDTRPGTFAYPDPAQNRLEPDTVLIGRPQLNCGLGKRLPYRVQLLREVFLNAS
jgi:hypothetical protein